MSIAAFIDNPKTDVEKSFYIPIATEHSFTSLWEPAFESLDLQWIPSFAIGIDISREDLQNVLIELSQIREWVQENLSDIKSQQVIERVDILLKELPSAFSREDVIVSIG
jgi:hypothetical protein